MADVTAVIATLKAKRDDEGLSPRERIWAILLLEEITTSALEGNSAALDRIHGRLSEMEAEQ